MTTQDQYVAAAELLAVTIKNDKTYVDAATARAASTVARGFPTAPVATKPVPTLSPEALQALRVVCYVRRPASVEDAGISTDHWIAIRKEILEWVDTMCPKPPVFEIIVKIDGKEVVHAGGTEAELAAAATDYSALEFLLDGLRAGTLRDLARIAAYARVGTEITR